jgi:hypothetical protein
MEITCLVTKPGCDITEPKILNWPETRKSKKCVLLKMGRRTEWFPQWAYIRLRELFANAVTPESLPKLLESISMLFNNRDDSLVRVRESNKISTSADRGYFLIDVQETLRIGTIEDTHPVTLTVLLPLTVISKNRDESFAPVWALRDYPDDYQRLVSIWAGHEALKAEFNAHFVSLQTRLDARIEREQRKRQGEFDL